MCIYIYIYIYNVYVHIYMQKYENILIYVCTRSYIQYALVKHGSKYIIINFF